MKHFFVVAREDKKEILEFVQKLTDYIEKGAEPAPMGSIRMMH